MRDIIKKTFLLGLGAASLTKSQAEKIVNELVKRNAVTIKEGRDMIKRVGKEAFNEGNKIKKLAEKEAKKMARNLGITSKGSIEKVKKMLKSTDKYLSAKGKKTLKEILNELSK